MIILFIKYICLFFALAFLLIFIADRLIRAKGYRGPVSDHFDGKKFLNQKSPEETPRGFGNLLVWMMSREKNTWEKRTITPTKLRPRIDGKEILVTMINHASVLIQTEGLNIITDPVYSKRASPFSFIGPQRFMNPGIAFEDLPKIDIILLSHNHYDHLDITTLKRIVSRDNPRIFVPLGNKEFLKRHGITSTELDWWQTRTLTNEISLTCVEAQHFSARALSDRNTTLWCGWVIKTPDGDIYFAGDTGFGPFLDQISLHFPNGFRLGLLPVGAFRPEWFMKKVHMSPDEAFETQKKLSIQNVFAIHFGTFKLADDKQDEPTDRVNELNKKLQDQKRFVALPNGGSMQIL